MNIWEFQKEQLRKRIADDKGNFYSYSKEHLSLAFPLINENEIKVKEKEANQARWKTQKGFDNMLKQLNPNEHPKKPHQSMIDDLQHSYAQQRYNTKMKLAGKVYKPEDDGKADFWQVARLQAIHSPMCNECMEQCDHVPINRERVRVRVLPLIGTAALIFV